MVFKAGNMYCFTAIDFETAQAKRWSICQVGLVRVEQGLITRQLSILVQPPENLYWPNFSAIHGISAADTAEAPRFDQIWPQIAGYIEGQQVVAHNGFSFDFPCLRQTLDYYELSVPEFKGHCSYRIYGKKLALLCQEHNIELNHHDALSDAKACAELFLKHLNSR